MPRDGTLPKTLVALVADLFCGAGGSPTGARGLAGPDRLGVDQVVWYGAAIMALVYRLLKAYRTDGATGLVSKRRGRPSNRRKLGKPI